MTSPFDTTGPSKLGKEFKPRNDKPGKLPPINLPGSSKFVRNKQEKSK